MLSVLQEHKGLAVACSAVVSCAVADDPASLRPQFELASCDTADKLPSNLLHNSDSINLHSGIQR